jgi:hypothetical protein
LRAGKGGEKRTANHQVKQRSTHTGFHDAF